MKEKLSIVFFVLIIIAGISCDDSSSSKKSGPEILFSEDFSGYGIGDAVSSDWKSYFGASISNQVLLDEKALSLAGGAAFYDGTGASSWTNYTLTFRFTSDNSDGYFGVFLRTDPQSEPVYYQINLGYEESYRYAMVKGSSFMTEVLSDDFPWVADTYHTVKVVINGGNIKIYFDNADSPSFDYTDASDVIASGGIGFTSHVGTTYIDDIVVTSL